MGNAAIVIDLLLRVTAQAQAYAALLHRSRSENRDVSTQELAELKAGYAADRQELLDLIASKS